MRAGEPYRGYFNMTADPRYAQSQLFKGDTITVPARDILRSGTLQEQLRRPVLGFVPEKDVIGRPLFIYYPFTRRWERRGERRPAPRRV